MRTRLRYPLVFLYLPDPKLSGHQNNLSVLIIIVFGDSFIRLSDLLYIMECVYVVPRLLQDFFSKLISLKVSLKVYLENKKRGSLYVSVICVCVLYKPMNSDRGVLQLWLRFGLPVLFLPHTDLGPPT